MPASNQPGCDEERNGFYADLADGLHAMAQPLTILRSAIAMLALAGETDEARRQRNVEISARQIDRACSLFSSLQNLVATEMEAASRAPMDLQALLSRVLEDQAPAYQKKGVSLAASYADVLPLALGDAEKTEQALAALLEAVLSVSGQGDRVEIGVSCSDGFCEFSIAAAPGSRGRLNSAERLHLAVAKANVLNQPGRFTFAEEPLRGTIALPACEPDLSNKKALLEVFAASS